LKTIHINLFGGPGVGKSTLALRLATYFKLKGVSVDLTMEFAKECVYDKNFDVLKDQFYIAGEQHKRMKRLDNSVTIAIHDSPFIMGLTYCTVDEYHKSFETFMFNQFLKYNNYNIFLQNNKLIEFENENRIQNEYEAYLVSRNIQLMLDTLGVDHYSHINNDELYNRIIHDIEGELDARKSREARV